MQPNKKKICISKNKWSKVISEDQPASEAGFPSSSAEEFACNAGDPGSIPGSGSSPGKGIGYPLQCSCFPCDSAGKESTCNVGDLGSIPGLGRSPGEGNSYLLQYSCLENYMDRKAWRATVHEVVKSWTWLSDFHFTLCRVHHVKCEAEWSTSWNQDCREITCQLIW